MYIPPNGNCLSSIWSSPGSCCYSRIQTKHPEALEHWRRRRWFWTAWIIHFIAPWLTRKAAVVDGSSLLAARRRNIVVGQISKMIWPLHQWSWSTQRSCCIRWPCSTWWLFCLVMNYDQARVRCVSAEMNSSVSLPLGEKEREGDGYCMSVELVL